MSFSVIVKNESFKKYPEDIEVMANEIAAFLFENGVEKPDAVCVIKADTERRFPNINIENNSYVITLTNNVGSYWNSQLYELAHELLLFFMRSSYVKDSNDTDWGGLNWVEETVCEASSFFFLDYYANNWSKSAIKRSNNNYAHYFSDYACQQNAKNERQILSYSGVTIENVSEKEFKELNEAADNKDQRVRRARVMLRLADIMRPWYFKGLVQYRNYIKNGLYLDSERYIRDFPGNKAVELLCLISDRIADRSVYKDLLLNGHL